MDSWFFLLARKALAHINLKVRRVAVSYLLSTDFNDTSNRCCNFSLELLWGPLLDAIGDRNIYGAGQALSIGRSIIEVVLILSLLYLFFAQSSVCLLSIIFFMFQLFVHEYWILD
jgi:hypothetical protein